MKNLKFFTLFGFTALLFSTTSTFAQNIGISTTGATPNEYAILDIKSNSQGVLLPRMTTSQRESFDNNLGTSEKGMTVYDTDINTYCIWTGSTWAILNGDDLGDHVATQNLQLNGYYLVYDADDTKGLYIADGGKVGIHTNTPQTTLDINGTMVVGGNNNPLFNSSSNGTALNGNEGVILSGGTSQYLIGVEVGNGRIQHKRNATYGGHDKFSVGGEDASMMD